MTSRSLPWAVAAVTAALLASLPVALPASDPMGVYAVVQKVVLEPDEAEPLRIQVWGAFAVSDGKRDSDAYTAPQVGYLYYSCPSGQERICRNEWSDLKSVAGKGIGVGFGGRYLAAGRVRKASEAPASPEPYPIKMGVTRMTSLHEQPAIIAQLKAALPAR